MLASDSAPIKQPTGWNGASFVVDMHSRTGFSGSPVFAYRTFGSDLTTDQHAIERLVGTDSGTYIQCRTLFYCLGINWGQFTEQWELRTGTGANVGASSRPHLIADGAYVRGVSGMTCVVPAWEIQEVLSLPKLQKDRELKTGPNKLLKG